MKSRGRKPILATIGFTAVVLLTSIGGAAYAAQIDGTRSCTGIRGVTISSSVTANAGRNGHSYLGTSQSGSGYSWVTSTFSTGSRTTYSNMKSGEWSVFTTAGSINSASSSCYYL